MREGREKYRGKSWTGMEGRVSRFGGSFHAGCPRGESEDCRMTSPGFLGARWALQQTSGGTPCLWGRPCLGSEHNGCEVMVTCLAGCMAVVMHAGLKALKPHADLVLLGLISPCLNFLKN